VGAPKTIWPFPQWPVLVRQLEMSLLIGFLGTHPWEILLIGVVFLLLFGNRLPSLMRSMGRSVVEFKKGVKEIEEDGDDETRPHDD
jgi:sec-independent protein translocase protein TatA